jgi:dienelactone hydrolase
MRTESIEYQEGTDVFDGFLAKPDAPSKHPAVLVAHAWRGRDEFADERAKRLAELGYIGFAIDYYGKGKRAANDDEARALMMPLAKDRALLRRRLIAAVDAVRSRDDVDASKVAAIGFCFGGLCALDLARAGAPVAGVVAFHGLFFPAPIPNAKITAKVLALHGWDDPSVPPEAVVAFAKEMTDAGADWQLHGYGHTVHAFTNPQANARAEGKAYDAKADARSWTAMTNFLAELFG